MPPKTKTDKSAEEKVQTVGDQAAALVRKEVTFADYDRLQTEAGDPYAVEGNDTSGYIGVNSEYRTYASPVDAPLTEEQYADAKAAEDAKSDDDDSEDDKSNDDKSDDGNPPAGFNTGS